MAVVNTCCSENALWYGCNKKPVARRMICSVALVRGLVKIHLDRNQSRSVSHSDQTGTTVTSVSHSDQTGTTVTSVSHSDQTGTTVTSISHSDHTDTKVTSVPTL